MNSIAIKSQQRTGPFFYHLLMFLFLLPFSASSQLSWVKTDATTFSSIALRSDGTIWTWGFNVNGQLGTGNILQRNIPTQVGTDTNWINISAGGFHIMALKSDGSLWTWGLNGSGQLGIASTAFQQNAPVQVGMDTSWRYISAGRAHCLAIKADSSLWGWGMNIDGQLGDGTKIDRNAPKQIGSAHKWLMVSSGGGHSMAIRADGSLWAWGNGGNGQIGDGTNNNRTSMVQVGSDTNWAEISAGMIFTIARKKDSSLWAWGDNNVGQVGNGIFGNVNNPVHISTGNKFISIDAGSAFSFAIRSDSALFGWGINHLGQLGNGTVAQQSVPVRIGTGNDWVDISASEGEMQNNVVFGFHSIGIRASSMNAICSSGNNLSGQLGNGTTTSRLTITCNSGILVGIDEMDIEEVKPIKLYPNPTRGSFMLSMDLEDIPILILLKDIQGRTIRQVFPQSNQLQVEINGPAGIYLLEFRYADERVITKKLIKQ